MKRKTTGKYLYLFKTLDCVALKYNMYNVEK